MEKRKAAMWKEAAVPSAMPSRAPPSRTTPSCAVPSHAAAVPSHAAAVPSASAARQRRRSKQCNADRDRRRETGQFQLARAVTHWRALQDKVAPRNEVSAVMFIPLAANQNFVIGKTLAAAEVMNKNSFT
jgi:hypothetical protein